MENIETGASSPTPQVEISLDPTQALADVLAMLREVAAFNQLQAELLESSFELVTLDSDVDAAACTSHCRTVLKATDQFLLFVSALRTFNLDARARIELTS